MANPEPQITRALDQLLETEYKSIRDGAYDALPKILAEKERMLERLMRERVDPGLLVLLRGKIARNATLLSAASRGIRSAIQRLDIIKNGPLPLTTYGPQGAITSMGPKRLTMERKA